MLNKRSLQNEQATTTDSLSPLHQLSEQEISRLMDTISAIETDLHQVPLIDKTLLEPVTTTLQLLRELNSMAEQVAFSKQKRDRKNQLGSWDNQDGNITRTDSNYS